MSPPFFFLNLLISNWIPHIGFFSRVESVCPMEASVQCRMVFSASVSISSGLNKNATYLNA